MGNLEAIKVVATKIKHLDPENAFKIMHYIVANLQEDELLHLASSPDHVFHSLVMKVKQHLELSSPSPLITNITNPFSLSKELHSLSNNLSKSFPFLPQEDSIDFGSEASLFSYDKCLNLLMQIFNEELRGAAVMKGDKKNDFMGNVSAEKDNSSARKIFLTFTAESILKEKDVSEYFSQFGPVQDVRIPYQKKRTYGFVTFTHPRTVNLILSLGNPHLIGDSSVRVKPYKVKGEFLDKRLREEFEPCLGPSVLYSIEPNDSYLGARMSNNPHERRKLEEQAEMKQALELQERRLKNLQLPDFKNNPAASAAQPQQEVGPAGIHDADNDRGQLE